MSAHVSLPDIRTVLPGPKAQRVIERDRRVLSPSYTRFYPLVVDRGEGAMIYDVDGNRFLDFTAGIAVCATGHCHPRVTAAVAQQAGRLLHMSGTDFYNEPQTALAERLCQLAPGPGDKRVFFTNSGAEAVEAALKLARYHTGRPWVLAFHGAFHGRTYGAMSLTASKAVQRRGFAPLLPGVVHADFPNPYRCPPGCTPDDYALLCVESIRERIFARTAPADETAAIIVEPIQGEGGYIVPPPTFHRALQELAREHGILLVADEIQAGMGRTGQMFASSHFGLEPDIICLAKGIASGLPLGAIVARAEVMNWPPGSHASTFGGNPVSCVAALETIALLQEGLMDNAARQGQWLIEQFRALQNRHHCIGDVRGLGLMIGVELVADRAAKRPAPKLRDDLVYACFRRGLLLLGCGESTLRLAPPLMIDGDQAAAAVRIIDAALTELTPAA